MRPARRPRGAAWTRLRQQIIAAAGPAYLCTFCGTAVDITLRWPDRLSASVDHVHGLSGDPWDAAGLALAHLACNTAAGRRHRRPQGAL